jgi:hypothetical protein
MNPGATGWVGAFAHRAEVKLYCSYTAINDRAAWRVLGQTEAFPWHFSLHGNGGPTVALTVSRNGKDHDIAARDAAVA